MFGDVCQCHTVSPPAWLLFRAKAKRRVRLHGLLETGRATMSRIMTQASNVAMTPSSETVRLHYTLLVIACHCCARLFPDSYQRH